MNVLKILNEPGPLEEIMKWLWEGENYKGGGWHFKDEKISKEWPTFWKAIPKAFPHVTELMKQMIEDSDVVFVSRTGDEIWFSFAKLRQSKSDPKVSVAGNKITLKVDRNLNVAARRG